MTRVFLTTYIGVILMKENSYESILVKKILDV